jgi:hypothetical protein
MPMELSMDLLLCHYDGSKSSLDFLLFFIIIHPSPPRMETFFFFFFFRFVAGVFPRNLSNAN